MMSFPSPITESMPLFRLAFRPFFLSAAMFAFSAMVLWLLSLIGYVVIMPGFGLLWWHGHELIFGFAGAVLMGFLLTAAKNWTGLPSISGKALFLLFMAWLLPRVLYLLPNHSLNLVGMIIETLFWGAGAYFFANMIIRKRMWRNLVFILVLVVLCLLSWGSTPAIGFISFSHALHVAVFILVLAITIIGGRVIPFFTASATNTSKVSVNKWLEYLTIMLTLVTLVTGSLCGFNVPSELMAALFCGLTVVNTLRMLSWPIRLSLKTPMLWSLYLAYFLMVMGFALLAAYHLNLIANFSAALHMITVGGIGLMIFSMISRVSLGHTGRSITHSKRIKLGFFLILLASIMRSLLIAFDLGGSYQWVVSISAILWCVAFFLWLTIFTPILSQPRIDNKPG